MPRLRATGPIACVIGSVTLLCAGCVIEASFDPTADTGAALVGEWTIGGAPASAETCEASGITSVELRLYDDTGSDYYSDDGLLSLCAEGTLTSSARFIADTYRVQWIVTDSSDEVLWQSRFDTLTIDGETIEVRADLPSVPANGFNPRGTAVSLRGAWTIDGAPPTTSNCAARGIVTVEVGFYDDEDGDAASRYTDSDFSFACDLGSFARSNVLAEGAVKVQWSARDADGNRVAEDGVLDLVLRPGEVSLPDFAL